MTTEQLTDQVIKHNSEIAALKESGKSAHKRIDENDRITEGIHKLAANVEALALQVKLLTEKMDNSIERIEASLKSQGARIGELEKEPATKWKDLVKQVVGYAVTAILAVVAAKLL